LGGIWRRNRSRYAIGSINPGTTLTTTGAFRRPTRVDHAGQGWGCAASAIGQGFFGLAFQTANFASLLNFLETQGNVQVLSSPRIATINNQKAVLKVGTTNSS
jgi:MSHA biogenesis protein MshL